MPPRRARVGPRLASPQSEGSVFQIDSDDDTDLESVIFGGAGPAKVRQVGEPRVEPVGMDEMFAPLDPVELSPIEPLRTESGRISRQGRGKGHVIVGGHPPSSPSGKTGPSSKPRPTNSTPPKWLPGCKWCNHTKTKRVCRAWPGLPCLECKRRRKGCDLANTNSKPEPAESAASDALAPSAAPSSAPAGSGTTDSTRPRPRPRPTYGRPIGGDASGSQPNAASSNIQPPRVAKNLVIQPNQRLSDSPDPQPKKAEKSKRSSVSVPSRVDSSPDFRLPSPRPLSVASPSASPAPALARLHMAQLPFTMQLSDAFQTPIPSRKRAASPELGAEQPSKRPRASTTHPALPAILQPPIPLPAVAPSITQPVSQFAPHNPSGREDDPIKVEDSEDTVVEVMPPVNTHRRLIREAMLDLREQIMDIMGPAAEKRLDAPLHSCERKLLDVIAQLQ